MEESVKRRERLEAMRMEALRAGVYNDGGCYSVSHGLSNPLIETSASPLAQVEACATPRFDYYTDPLSAFSGNKRSGKVNNQNPQEYLTPPTGSRNPEISPAPVRQALTNYSPDQSMYQTRGPHYSSGPYRSPIGMASPFGAHQGTPPRVWNGSGGSPSYCFPSNSSRAGNFPSPGFVQGGCPSFSGQGRGHWFSNNPSPGSGYKGSPSPNSGRGRGRWFGSGMSPGSGRSGGRGLGYHDHVSAEFRPDRHYNKSMVEDPWKFLKPIICRRENVATKSLNSPDSLKSWLPNSISMKKARVSEASNVSTSKLTGPSLAEYLADSFNDAVKDEAVNDEPTL